MQTSMDIRQSFMADLKALLKKYGAELSAEDHYPGYPESGEDVRMTVDISAVYDNNGNLIREQMEIDLGSYIKAE